jgi:2-polyprenyl-3-methyl-5-hydroxy-6-metoxy-1,4-benzoquinol methylase
VVRLQPFPTREEARAHYEVEGYYQNPDRHVGYQDYRAQEELLKRTFRHRMAVARKFCSASSGRFLEIGCALGFMADVVAEEQGNAYLGIDLNPEAVRTTSGRGHAARWGGVGDLPEDEQYDVVVCFDVVEHVVDQVAFVSGIGRRLRMGGHLLLTTPSTTSLLARLSGRRWVSYVVPQHVVLHSAASMRLLLGRAGLTVARVSADLQWVHPGFLCSRLALLSPVLGTVAGGLLRATRASRKVRGLPVPNGNMYMIARKDSAEGRHPDGLGVGADP